mmetsp:Transcript_109914/g.342657  ORF Transcript_109914/g.342657 Transcript_109914/m.342657 type:complete len:239 (-) Transcript_109914:561-1277(-)
MACKTTYQPIKRSALPTLASWKTSVARSPSRVATSPHSWSSKCWPTSEALGPGCSCLVPSRAARSKSWLCRPIARTSSLMQASATRRSACSDVCTATARLLSRLHARSTSPIVRDPAKTAAPASPVCSSTTCASSPRTRRIMAHRCRMVRIQFWSSLPCSIARNSSGSMRLCRAAHRLVLGPSSARSSRVLVSRLRSVLVKLLGLVASGSWASVRRTKKGLSLVCSRPPCSSGDPDAA